MSTGSNESIVWSYFGPSNKFTATCNFCGGTITANTKRLKCHLTIGCVRCPQRVQDLVLAEETDQDIFEVGDRGARNVRDYTSRILALIKEKEKMVNKISSLKSANSRLALKDIFSSESEANNRIKQLMKRLNVADEEEVHNYLGLPKNPRRKYHQSAPLLAANVVETDIQSNRVNYSRRQNIAPETASEKDAGDHSIDLPLTFEYNLDPTLMSSDDLPELTSTGGSMLTTSLAEGSMAASTLMTALQVIPPFVTQYHRNSGPKRSSLGKNVADTSTRLSRVSYLRNAKKTPPKAKDAVLPEKGRSDKQTKSQTNKTQAASNVNIETIDLSGKEGDQEEDGEQILPHLDGDFEGSEMTGGCEEVVKTYNNNALKPRGRKKDKNVPSGHMSILSMAESSMSTSTEQSALQILPTSDVERAALQVETMEVESPSLAEVFRVKEQWDSLQLKSRLSFPKPVPKPITVATSKARLMRETQERLLQLQKSAQRLRRFRDMNVTLGKSSQESKDKTLSKVEATAHKWRQPKWAFSCRECPHICAFDTLANLKKHQRMLHN